MLINLWMIRLISISQIDKVGKEKVQQMKILKMLLYQNTNDLTKKDRERELELVAERNQKNSLEVGLWKFVIRGPPGYRKLQKTRKQA